jgi:hypothetical protein
VIAFPYTDENHFRFGLSAHGETHWYGSRKTNDEEFVAAYGRATSAPTSWRAANELAARKILDLAGQRNLVPVVCYGGGIDSEVVLTSFLKVARKDESFEVATLEFPDRLNQHDTAYVDKFKAQVEATHPNVQFRRFELDPRQFLKSEDFLTLARETQIVAPPVVCQLWLCREIQMANPRAMPIIGQGELHMVRTEDLTGSYRAAPWSVAETENLCGLFRYFIARGLPAIPGFFQYLPEQFETQLRTNPVLHELLSNSRFGKLGTRTSKAEIIASDYPELERREKFTGFEKLNELHDEVRERLGREMPACEAKWKQPVWDLIDSLRPIATGTASIGDWNYAWAFDDGPRTARTSIDDVFATEWNSKSLLQDAFKAERPLADVRNEFISACRSLIAESSNFIHDGSLMARLFTCLAAANGAKRSRLLAAPVAGSIVASDLMSRLLQNPSLERETLPYVLMSELGTDDKTLLPLLHMRIVNAELDRELDTTLTHPRFIWIESERLAVLAGALPSAILPWTRSPLNSLVIQATRAMGWFDEDEPSLSNRTVFERFLESCLSELGETDSQRDAAAECLSDFAKFREEIANALWQCAWRQTSAQVAATDLAKAPSQLEKTDLATPLAKAGLRVVPTANWLAAARTRTPEIRLGSNLFFQQNLPGFSRLDPSTRVSVAWVDSESGEEVAWAHVCCLSLPPHGRLRIRGVTTRADVARRGHASELLKAIVLAFRESRPPGFDSIDVYAAPEVVTAFRRAGFVDDEARITRAEEGVDRATGKLVALDRELTPLTFHL